MNEHHPAGRPGPGSVRQTPWTAQELAQRIRTRGLHIHRQLTGRGRGKQRVVWMFMFLSTGLCGTDACLKVEWEVREEGRTG